MPWSTWSRTRDVERDAGRAPLHAEDEHFGIALSARKADLWKKKFWRLFHQMQHFPSRVGVKKGRKAQRDGAGRELAR
jgi:hypothetical protein